MNGGPGVVARRGGEREIVVQVAAIDPPARRLARDSGTFYPLPAGREPLGVVIFDEDHYRGLGLASVLLAADGLAVVGIVTDEAELSAVIGRSRPQVVLMRTAAAVSLPGAGPCVGGAAKVVAVTMPMDSPELLSAAVPRVHGFVRNQDSPELIEEAVRVVAGGNIWISSGLWQRIVPDRRLPRNAIAASVLTERERQVLGELAAGLTNREIAEAMYLGLSTVKTHIAAIMGKLDARNRVELTRAAIRMGLGE